MQEGSHPHLLVQYLCSSMSPHHRHYVSIAKLLIHIDIEIYWKGNSEFNVQSSSVHEMCPFKSWVHGMGCASMSTALLLSKVTWGTKFVIDIESEEICENIQIVDLWDSTKDLYCRIEDPSTLAWTDLDWTGPRATHRRQSIAVTRLN